MTIIRYLEILLYSKLKYHIILIIVLIYESLVYNILLTDRLKMHFYYISGTSIISSRILSSLKIFVLSVNREGDKLVPSVQKKISELEVSLLHLQQNIDIPDIQLTIHPAISGVVQKAAEENRKPKVEDFGNQVSDSTFLNQLQKDVSRWIKEIKKVLNFFTLISASMLLTFLYTKVYFFNLQQIRKFYVP